MIVYTFDREFKNNSKRDMAWVFYDKKWSDTLIFVNKGRISLKIIENSKEKIYYIEFPPIIAGMFLDFSSHEKLILMELYKIVYGLRNRPRSIGRSKKWKILKTFFAALKVLEKHMGKEIGGGPHIINSLTSMDFHEVPNSDSNKIEQHRIVLETAKRFYLNYVVPGTGNRKTLKFIDLISV